MRTSTNIAVHDSLSSLPRKEDLESKLKLMLSVSCCCVTIHSLPSDSLFGKQVMCEYTGTPPLQQSHCPFITFPICPGNAVGELQ